MCENGTIWMKPLKAKIRKCKAFTEIDLHSPSSSEWMQVFNWQFLPNQEVINTSRENKIIWERVLELANKHKNAILLLKLFHSHTKIWVFTAFFYFLEKIPSLQPKKRCWNLSLSIFPGCKCGRVKTYLNRRYILASFRL